MWNEGWDKLFSRCEWGKFPSEDLVRFVARNFYARERATVSFLEIGCGPGANLRFLAGEGFEVHGLDGSAVALERAGQRLERDGLKVNLHQGDAMNLPFPDGTFDCVVDIECIYANDLPDSAQIIAEAWRVLKPGGWLFSKTFATGMTGEGSGETKPGEPNTYLRMEGPLHSEYGIIRLTSEEEIGRLYGRFPERHVDYVLRSDRNQGVVFKEWLIACKKSDGGRP
jgi:SAM-dependent methyltransferase